MLEKKNEKRINKEKKEFGFNASYIKLFNAI